MTRNKIEKHFGRNLPEVIQDSSDYPMMLMALGEKLAALTMNATDEEIEAVKDFCNDFEFKMRVRSGRTSKPSGPTGGRPEDQGRCIFIAREGKRFQKLEESEGRFYSYSDRAVGEFLGFPESAIEFFNSTEQPGMESRKKIEQLRQNGEIQDVKYIGLTTYIPAPEKEAIEEAIETGRERAEELRAFDREKDLDIGDKYIQRRIEDSFYSEIQ